MSQSLTPQLEQEETNRMANIIARGSDREVIENQTPTVNVTNRDAGVTPQMREALAQMPGGNSKADYLDKWNQVTDVRLSGKKQLDNRTEWEKDVDRSKELKNPNWKNDFISSKNFDRDGYLRNLPRVVDGKYVNRYSGELWTQKDWTSLHAKFGQPRHYVPEEYKAKGV